jgi:hypothetical protein
MAPTAAQHHDGHQHWRSFFVRILPLDPYTVATLLMPRTLQAVRSASSRSAHAYSARKTISLTLACTEIPGGELGGSTERLLTT